MCVTKRFKGKTRKRICNGRRFTFFQDICLKKERKEKKNNIKR